MQHACRSVSAVTYALGSGEPLAMPGMAQSVRPLEVFDCAEQGGFVWLFFGDKDMPISNRPSIPWVPELDLPGDCRLQFQGFQLKR
jgi:phenylpropionate dioxygenase-like ring-hydroxylating dioxygenase large terminal subunit